MDPSNEFKYRSQALRCHGCSAVAHESENWTDSKHTKGLMIGVELKGGGHG